ncbi:hypothetical protein KXV64_001926 [Aspergillus fumigatus]|nr:hypothetical protein KXW60_003643 [Aspergillus fumigatus]KAH3206080.1 hypothetical protein KXW62_003599 [Aspergillus fumigatus]KAH3269525.1 hypothetical protein KXW55_003836 [Aspergillus fumigatus]KAH3532036.1 hypothetical protein KXV64_001926 [Aspergillus fumigatus]
MPPVVAHGISGDVTTGTTASGVPQGVPVSNNSGAAQPGVPPSVPGSMAVGPISSGVLPVPATAPLGATPSSIPGGTASAASVLGPINLETAYVTNEIPFDNEGQFLRPNGERELNDSDSGFDTDETAEDKIMRDVGNDNELKLGQRREKKFLKCIAKCDDPENLVLKLRALLREGERMSLQQLQEILMPSRWALEYQAQAHSAQKSTRSPFFEGKR